MNQPIVSKEVAHARSMIESESDSIFDLRPLPSIAMRVSRACVDEGTNTAELARIVESDAIFATKILQVVNSSLYGCTREITTIKQGLVVLGRRTVVQLAMSIAAKKVFDSDDGTKELRQRIFEHSLATASTAEVLLKYNSGDFIDPGSAFLSGIVHDIGKLVLLDLAPNAYSQLVEQTSSEVSLFFAERELFGADHALLGAQLGQTWELATAIVGVIRNHHSSEIQNETPLTQAVELSNQLVKRWGLGQPESTVHTDFAEAWIETQPPEQVEEIRQVAIDQFAETRSLLMG